MNPVIRNKSCAVVVTFKPDVTLLLKLLGQLNKETDFIVIDNASPEIGRIAESIEVYPRCRKLLRLDHNHGLAHALNLGLDWAREQDCEFAFLFDQDSRLCDLFVDRMIAAYREASQFSERGVAAVGPRLINPQSMRQTPFKLFNRLLFRSDRLFPGCDTHFMADFLITSGSMLALEHLPGIGPMKEDLFIDNVDLEWCFRAKSLGFDLIGTDDAVLYHAIGERSMDPLVRAGIMAKHNPARTYYSSRNRVHLYGLDYSPLGWKLRDLLRFSLKASWLLLASQERRAYWHHISTGIRDADSLGALGSHEK